MQVIEVLDKRLNDKGKSWRHVFKVCGDTPYSEQQADWSQALNVLEFLLFWGPQSVMHYCQANLYVIKTLREFQYIDDNGVDCGMNVRQKAKDITNLVLNPNLLKSKRVQHGHDDYSHRPYEMEDLSSSRHSPPRRPRASTDNNEDMRRALVESRRQQQRKTSEDQDLQRALQLSKEEEERRQKAIANSNGNLFNDLASEQ